ncbi:TonB-dependent siderophore receptor [Actomonas aquatica]|uniref:TonB-dependent receptor n=1 Tax=Actomonas aquatica TaxID=2866162 RepID=A0ABZ1C284_9BACT|nr:TonB-dependent receptor [Opitutus sp. WL0086]WRQ85516.1 TonB-dependent receptor [Opitutus sp. WL0086]
MNKNSSPYHFRRLAFAAPFFAAALSPTIAQQAAEAEPHSEEAIVMSPFVVHDEEAEGYATQASLVGSRSVTEIADIPAALTVLNHELLTDLGAFEASSALKFGVSGVTQNQTINDDTNIRGFRASQAMRDGVLKALYKRNPMYDVERIEVIKGPAGMLLGQNGYIGGVINFVSREPTLNPEGEIKASLGEDSYMRLEVNSSGPIVKSDDFTALYRVTLGATSGDTTKDIWADDDRFFGTGLMFHFGEDQRTTINFRLYNSVDNGYFYWADFLDASSTAQNPIINPYSTRDFSVGRGEDAKWDDEEWFGTVDLMTRLTDNANVRIRYSYNDHEDERLILRGSAIGADNVTLQRQYIPYESYSSSHLGQLDFLYNWETDFMRHDISMGGDVSHGRSHGSSVVVVADPIDVRNPDFSNDDSLDPNTPRTNRSRGQSTNASLYIQDNAYFFDDKLILVGGFRWFDTYSRSENLATDSTSINDNPWVRTYKYGVVYKPVDGLSLYFTEAQNLIPQSGFTTEEVPQPYRDQEGNLTEFGVKWSRDLSDTVSINMTAALFDMELTNVRTQGVGFNSRGEQIYIQSEQDSSEGWEADIGLRFNFSESAHADLIATYYHAETEQAGTGRATVDAPEDVYSLMGKISFTDGPLKGLMFGGGAYDQTEKYNGGYWLDFPTTYSAFARYDWGESWSAQLNAENLTDEYYLVAVALSGLVQTSQPRTVRLSVGYSW